MNSNDSCVILSGYSCDKKYRLRDEKGNAILIREFEKDSPERVSEIFELMKLLDKHNIPMSKPVQCILSPEKRIIRQMWLPGKTLREFGQTASKIELASYGRRAGKLLKAIHSIPVSSDMAWNTYFSQQIDRKVKDYMSCGVQLQNDRALISYISRNMNLIKDRPLSLVHGDYHVDNMIVGDDGSLSIIDFDSCSFADPWKDFDRLFVCAAFSPIFARELVTGYFDNHIPTQFWKVCSFYSACKILSWISWASRFDDSRICVILDLAKNAMLWNNDFQMDRPAWFDQK